VLYNRASCDLNGKPFNRERALVSWNGTAWGGADVPDFKVDEDPAHGMGPFIRTRKGWRGSLHAVGWSMVRSRALRAVRNTAGQQSVESEGRAVAEQSGRACVDDDRKAFGKPDKFPHAATTYRLTEHFHYWTKHVRLNAITPARAVCRDRRCAGQGAGHRIGRQSEGASNRGYINAVAVVTKRLRALQIDGKTLHHVGIPIHWGFKGLAKPGFLANTLTPVVGDANSQTPEFKSFLVSVEKL